MTSRAVVDVAVVGSTTVDVMLSLLSEAVGLAVVVIVVSPVDVLVDTEVEISVTIELVVTTVAEEETSVIGTLTLEVEPTGRIALVKGAQSARSSPANWAGMPPSASR